MFYHGPSWEEAGFCEDRHRVQTQMCVAKSLRVDSEVNVELPNLTFQIVSCDPVSTQTGVLLAG